MSQQVLFIQGAGEGAHEVDAELVASLRRELGASYEIIYPAMPNEGDPDYFNWKPRIQKELAKLQEPVILVAHSVGTSMLLKYLSKTKVQKPVAGIFLLAAPFWGGAGWLYAGYEAVELPSDVAAQLPQGAPVFLYHCRDDDVVPYKHLALLKQLLPDAVTRRLEKGGHQFDNDLTPVAQDIKNLA